MIRIVALTDGDQAEEAEETITQVTKEAQVMKKWI